MLTLIKNAQIVNENNICQADVLIENTLIKKISPKINLKANKIIHLPQRRPITCGWWAKF